MKRALAELAPIRPILFAGEFIRTTSERTDLAEPQLRSYLEISFNEAEHALKILDGYDLTGKRFLEVGCGPGIMATALRKAGIELTTLEPGGNGIEFNKSLAWQVFNALDARGSHLEIPAEDLAPARHGTFDFIFSHNVLEHVGDLEACFNAMIGVLAPGGKLVGHCPNYLIPYEPHYGCWLIPLFPRWSRPFLSRKNLQCDKIWHSLNFITSRYVRKAANKHGCSVKFRNGVMVEAFERIGDEAIFQQRHGSLQKIYRVMKTLRVLPFLKKWPGQFGSPMTFEMCRPSSQRPF